MKLSHSKPTQWTSSTALLMAAAIAAAPLAGCNNKSSAAPPPPVDDTRMGREGPVAPPGITPEAHQGLSTKQKLVMLGGAAALYYLYQKHEKAQGQGQEGQYYLSKNGRVYYRDAEHRAHWVTPPPEGLQVAESEAEQYRGFQGYNNSSTGRDLTGLGHEENP